jgi:hypothetical protein
MRRSHHGLLAITLLFGVSIVAGTSLAVAQQEKTQQNAADEALNKSAPEAKDHPQAPPQTAPTQASQPGIAADAPAMTDGRLTAPGAPEASQDEPAKFSAENNRIDNLPILAYPLSLTSEQKSAIYQRLSQGSGPVSNINAKVSQQVPATLALEELPPEMLASIPSIRDYKFLRLSDRVLVVNPRESVVVGEITN